MELMTEAKNNRNQISEIGRFPDYWNSSLLKELSSFITKGSTPTTYGFQWQESGIQFLRSECVSDNGLDLGASKFISVKANEALKRSEIKSGDILTTITGNVGRFIHLDSDFGQGNINQHIARIRIQSEDVDTTYLFYFLSRPEIRDYFNSITTGQAYPQISLKQVRELPIYYPPTLSEQQAIASALSDVDELIRSLDGLIQKKQAIKKGTMQQLLTGKKRLPGFDGEWEVKMVTDFGDVVTGGTPSTLKKEFWNGDIPWITPTDIGQLKDIYTSDRLISDQGVKQVRRLPKNSLLVTCIASIGKNAVLRRDGACNQQINAIIPSNSYDVDFLYYLIEQNKQKLLSNSGKTSTAILSKNKFGNIEFLMPEFEEQKAIAQILSDMDRELQTLRQKREKYVQIKQGMMQELLTGRVRLV